MRRTESAIRDRLSYDPASGILSRIDTALEAGYLRRDGYRQVSIHGKKLLSHRVAWFLVTGAWPRHGIDHINGIKHDNRLENLRDIPMNGNQQNVGIRKHNKSGFPGVTRFRGKWAARIRHEGRQIHLGYWDNAEDAAASYELAKHALHRYQPAVRV